VGSGIASRPDGASHVARRFEPTSFRRRLIKRLGRHRPLRFVIRLYYSEILLRCPGIIIRV